MENTFKFQSTCRICSSQQENYLCILGEEGYRLNLQLKIRKYLYITVSTNDKLPKMICKNCCKKLNAIHKFANMALHVQNKFTKMLDGDVTDETDWITEHKSLLQTYLLKGKEECEIAVEDDITEVEVRVDPSLFLQCIGDDSGDDVDISSENTSPRTPEPFDYSIKNCYSDNPLSLDIANNQAKLTGTQSDTKPINSSGKDSPKKIKEDYVSITLCNPNINANHSLNSNITSTCSICHTSFSSEDELKTHVWTHFSNGGRKILMATDSNSIVYRDTESALSNNDDDTSSSENLNLQPFTCPVCGKQISTKGNLKVHLETHRPKGKYACDICGRIFKTQSNLFRHKEYHGGVQFPCNVCGRVYPTNSTLRAHSITHSDLRPHKCPLCDKTFKRNQDLKFHINQHTGARPYRCLYCPKAFASSGNCFSHRKRMHPQEVERDRERADQIMR